VLENTIVEIPHEEISILLMHELNRQFMGKLELAIEIFTNRYRKKYLHQLVSSQLDMDRLDYLSRDSFFTGVTEGIIGIDRIIKMLNIYDDQIVADVKGIYSIEKFLIARRLMYWQVYLHKTVVSADFQLINVLKRARELVASGENIFATPTLDIFLKNRFNYNDFKNNITVSGKNIIDWYSLLDDSDILASVKEWEHHHDPVLSYLAKSITNRKLFKIEIKSTPISKVWEEKILQKITETLTGNYKLSPYFLITGDITNNALNRDGENILILSKNGKARDIRNASDINLSALTKTVRKYFACFPKELDFY
jgi:HD superfamily phosphohydrolase